MTVSVFSFRAHCTTYERLADLRWAGFLPLNFMRSTKLSATTKLSAEHETPPIANVLLYAALFSVVSISNNFLLLELVDI